ncbi:MAG: tetratricopeptide repeat protein [Betaproteobacteria bacterium]|nr:tetratricopeptide repeat protein [Betaproteobacteria bacterium]
MSLLLDALKRAEAAKQAGLAEPAINNPATDNPAPATPSTAPAEKAPRRLELSIEDKVEDSFSRPLLTPAETITRRPEEVKREAVKNAFSAKQEPVSRKWLLPVFALLLTTVAAGGWYVWQQVNPIRPPLIPGRIQVAPPAGPAAAATAPAVQADNIALPPLLPAEVAELPRPKAGSGSDKAAQAEREQLEKQLQAARSQQDAPIRLRLSEAITPALPNPNLVNAYAALARGDYGDAKNLYNLVLQASPDNLDAHLGLATIAARRDNRAEAAKHYRRALEIDPRNSFAISGLVGLAALSGDTNAATLETELKTLITKDPTAAALQFSLGNLYASQNRWVEAQQTYFEAYRLQSDNADYLYNLAVSLDQLKQSKLALGYYQQALAARQTGQFNADVVQRRILQLKTEIVDKR